MMLYIAGSVKSTAGLVTGDAKIRFCVTITVTVYALHEIAAGKYS